MRRGEQQVPLFCPSSFHGLSRRRSCCHNRRLLWEGPLFLLLLDQTPTPTPQSSSPELGRRKDGVGWGGLFSPSSSPAHFSSSSPFSEPPPLSPPFPPTQPKNLSGSRLPPPPAEGNQVRAQRGGSVGGRGGVGVFAAAAAAAAGERGEEVEERWRPRFAMGESC